ncbi:hypothetical protein S83_070123, partial [Arachis hypogaea]
CLLYWIFSSKGSIADLLATSRILLLLLALLLLSLNLGLTIVDLLMADVKVLEAYAGYFYYLSKMWYRPFLKVYDPQDVAHYFSSKAHVVGLQILELVSPFSTRLNIIGVEMSK